MSIQIDTDVKSGIANLAVGLLFFTLLGGVVLAVSAIASLLKVHFGDWAFVVYLGFISVAPFAYIIGGTLRN